MKKLIILFIVVMVVVLGLFFWSMGKDDTTETKQSGTLVRLPIAESERGESNV